MKNPFSLEKETEDKRGHSIFPKSYDFGIKF